MRLPILWTPENMITIPLNGETFDGPLDVDAQAIAVLLDAGLTVTQLADFEGAANLEQEAVVEKIGDNQPF